MALQICPVCKQEDFTWSMTEDETGREVTVWECGCGFYAYEYEAYENNGYSYEHFDIPCAGCGSLQALKLLKDGIAYLWCNRCHLLTQQPGPAIPRPRR